MQPYIFTAALIFLVLALGLATWYSGKVLRSFTPSQNLLLTLPENLLRLALILVCVALGLFLGPGAAPLGWQTDRWVRDVVLGVVVAVVLFPVQIWVGKAVVRRWGPEIYDNRLLRAIVPVNRREWVGVVLALLTAATLEELLFRSLPLAGLSWLISPWVLMWPLSLGFGALHAAQGSWGVVGTAFMGLMLSVLFLVSGSIWVPIIAHWLLNVAEVTVAMRQGLRPLRYDARPEAPGR